jgi:hypothetical protein
MRGLSLFFGFMAGLMAFVTCDSWNNRHKWGGFWKGGVVVTTAYVVCVILTSLSGPVQTPKCSHEVAALKKIEGGK